MKPVTCPYCKQAAKLVTGAEIYPHRPDLYSKKFWQCPPCDAYVGCHATGIGYGDGTKPLGRLADANLRRAKLLAHSAFDPIWKTGRMQRGQAYKWLAKQLQMPPKDCHIGLFDVETCFRVVKLCRTL